MDTTKLKNPSFYLEPVLFSYNLLILFLIIFVVIMIMLVVYNYKGFNKIFGYEIFITGPILILLSVLIKEIFSFNADPTNSWFKILPQSNSKWFLPGISIITLLLGIISFFMMLYVGGIFSDNPPTNNISTMINFVIIILFVIIASLIYNNSKKKDLNTLNEL